MTTYKIIHIIICDVMFNIDNFFNLPVYKRIEKNLKCDQEYTRFYDLMFKSNIDIKNALMIGGARIFIS